jgi:hypothetical protein
MAAVLLAGAAAVSAQTPAPEPIVQIGVFGYQADGTNTGAAYDTEPSLESVVYVGSTLCQVGAGHRPAPTYATHAWRFSGRVLSKTAEEAVVQLTWQRVIEGAAPAGTPEASVQLTLRAGDRVPLDTAAPQSQSSCSVTSAVFEARYMPRRFGAHSITVGPSGVRVGASGVGRTSGGGGATRGTGGGTDTGAATSGVSATGGGVRIHATDPGLKPGERAGERLFEVNLWLVHKAPGKADEVLHQVLRAGAEGAAFAFAPVSVDTSHGPIMVQIAGSFVFPARQRLVFTTNRRVTRARTDQPARDRTKFVEGNSVTAKEMPGPDDVLSFEMPPVLSEKGEPALPDQFSVRVRIRPM